MAIYGKCFFSIYVWYVSAAEGKSGAKEIICYTVPPHLSARSHTHTNSMCTHWCGLWPNSSVHVDKKHTQTSGGLDAAEFLSMWAMPRRAPLWCAAGAVRTLQSIWNRPSVHETVMDTMAIKTKTAATKSQTDNKPFQIFRLFESPCAC